MRPFFTLSSPARVGPRVDNRVIPPLFAFVFLARRIAALLLVAVWLPALLHCRLEAAGLFLGAECCSETHAPAPTSAETCADDSCEVAEGEFTPPSSSSLAAPAPLLCACLFCSDVIAPTLAVTPPPVTGLDEVDASPPEITRTWVFVTRAALSPRAPSLA